MNQPFKTYYSSTSSDANSFLSAYGNSSYLFDFGISKDKNTAPEKAHARLQRVNYLPQDQITGDGSNLKTVFVLAHLLSCVVRVKNPHVHGFNARQLAKIQTL